MANKEKLPSRCRIDIKQQPRPDQSEKVEPVREAGREPRETQPHKLAGCVGVVCKDIEISRIVDNDEAVNWADANDTVESRTTTTATDMRMVFIR